MKRVIFTTLLLFICCGAGNLRAADFNYANTYSGSVGGGMMGTMLDFMEWFLGRRNNVYGNGLMTGASNPYRHRDYWDDPNNPWVDMQPLEGTWQAQSGEYWLIRDNRFVLINNNRQKIAGEFRMEGDFILTRMPGGEVEFEFRQMDDVLLMRDVNGRVMLLRRIESAGWSW